MGVLMPTTLVGITSIGVAIAGNSIFIYGLGSWRGLGFVGSPLSTVVAAWYQPCALFAYGFLYKQHHTRAWSGWDRRALTLCRLRAFASIAGPLAGNSFVSNLANALVSLVAAKLGPAIIAANAVVAGMWSLLWALFWGYGCATQVRVANYLGAGLPRAAQRVAKLGLVCTFAVVTVLALFTHKLDREVIAIYTTDDVLVATCRDVLPIFILAYVVESVEILLGGVLTGMRCVRATGL
jgi:multidrug resistance protein, MATE family